jgi:hypothetical protein
MITRICFRLEINSSGISFAYYGQLKTIFLRFSANVSYPVSISTLF